MKPSAPRNHLFSLVDRTLRTRWILLAALLWSACSPVPISTATSPNPVGEGLGVPTRTPFNPLRATATTQQIQIWISSDVPATLRTDLLAGLQEAGSLYRLTDDESTAQIVVEANPEIPLAEWVFAVVSAFSEIQDDLSYGTLQDIWRGNQANSNLLLLEGLSGPLSPLLGLPAQANVVEDFESLIEGLWEDPDSISILPFHLLDPRLKVLRIDGLSPLDRGPLADEYPLRVTFGARGEQQAVDWLFAEAEWPQSNRDPGKMTVLVMTGVTALVRATASRMDEFGAAYPGLAIADWLLDADYTHVSHEVSFAENCPPPDPFQSSLRFCSDPDHFELFKQLDIDLIELTGNHLLDWGMEPFLSTLDLYEVNGMAVFAGGQNLEQSLSPRILEHHGNRLAFLGCNAPGPDEVWAREDRAGAAPCDYEWFEQVLPQLRDQGMLPVFTFQWAEAKRLEPLPFQVEYFRRMVDAGAVIVSGSQAHRPQTLEFYQGRLIHYGLGNLFFDQMQTLGNRQEFIDRHVFYAGRHISTELLTAMLEDYAQPRPMTFSERLDFLSEIFSASGW